MRQQEFLHYNPRMSLSPDLLAELKKSIAGDVCTDLASRILYSTDASIYQIEPLGVVIPRSQDDLQAVVELAAKYRTPILPRGSGSSLAGQAIGEALIVDCSRWLDNIIEVNPETRTATVEPGVILAALNQAAAKHGLQFGPDPASAERATMGGILANNATGAHSILYGMAADHIVAADVVMADGSVATWREERIENREQGNDRSLFSTFYSSVLDLREKYAAAIRQNYPTTWRNSAGYRLNYLLPWSPSTPPQWTNNADRWTIYQSPVTNYQSPSTINLAPLLAGSEGTLAVIRRATVNLVPKPKHTVLAVLNYDSSAAACDDVPRLLEHRPSAIELISRNIVRLAMAVPAYASQARILAGEAEALLVIEFSGDQPEVLKERALALHPDVLAESAQDQSRIWNIRKMGLGILASHTGDAKTVAFIEDCAIPVERLGGFVRGVQHILDQYHTQAEFYAHASAGCLHIRPILDLKTQVRELRGISEAVLALTISLGGSMSSEHGDGLAHSEWLGNIYGEEVLAAFRALKLAADPERILNPGKLIDAPPMDANLRYGLDYHATAWPTPLDFSRQDGLANAIEQCNGQGVCRKFDGVMCPSFQATREEQNATRGRANLLRAMISAPNVQQPALSLSKGSTFNVESVFASLDLCLACKGCKSECPSGVDMAKIKFAFMDEYYKTHRRPLRDYIFGYFHTVSAMLASIAPLANAMMSFDPTRKLIAKVTGITAERPFPKYSMKRAHVGQIANLPKSQVAHTTNGQITNLSYKKILFLSDAFTRYIEPQVEQAAFDVLARLGLDVQVVPVVGAGASLLSKGFIDSARHHAERVLDAIQRIDPEGVMPIVGLEPPDLYCLKHDYRDLLPARVADLAAITRRTWLLEEWLLRSNEFTELRVAKLKKNGIASQADSKPQKLKFHPHCHQRAEAAADDGLPTGPAATVAMLQACGYEVEVSDAGCCGMAGTFGYEAEHYELSMKVGELKLLPSLKNSSPKSAGFGGGQEGVVSTGSACRLQIEQGAKVNTTHPIVLVARALKVA
ncbi:MAG: FAD-binding protein [Chloroflexi bacterium]|nr:FAD-binding protein [Chloroflexota bacterium]